MRYSFKILGFVAVLLFNASCGEEYLNTSPEASNTPSVIFNDTEGAKLAINGICRLTVYQYLKSQGFNGEGTVKLYYGNYMGTHFYVNQASLLNAVNHLNFENSNALHSYFCWYYYYMVIGNANAVIANIDNATGPESEKAYIKAQGLSFRAYAYMMLAQLYCYRWSDSNNGSSPGVVLRLDQSTHEMPLCTLSELYGQIYADLDEAISLYKSSGLHAEEDDFYSPHIHMAYATYSRAALNKKDYQKAATYAALAREGFPLMNIQEYKSGFNTPNPEWIWGSFNSTEENIHYFSFFAYVGYNSTTSLVGNYPKCISKTLYNKIPATDIRRNLFLDPSGYENDYTLSTGEVRPGTGLDTEARTRYPDLANSSKAYTYMQFKFSATDMPGVGNLVHFRSSEMYLNEAEAYYYLENETKARNLLTELTKNSGRNPSYTCDKTGEALLEEIKTYRYIELWGEGFDLFDTKRWGDPLIRLAYDEGGNFSTPFAKKIQPGENNKWTFRIPDKEKDYNDLIIN